MTDLLLVQAWHYWSLTMGVIGLWVLVGVAVWYGWQKYLDRRERKRIKRERLIQQTERLRLESEAGQRARQQAEARLARHPITPRVEPSDRGWLVKGQSFEEIAEVIALSNVFRPETMQR